jgi:hypothetical protein
MLTWKLRITVLWIFLAICQAAAFALLLLEPGVIHGLMTGQLWGVNTHSAGVQINTALFFLAPMAMAYLTLVLNAAASRWTSGVLGALTVVTGISALLGQPVGMSAGLNVVVTAATLAALLIVWHAWKGPRPAEVTPVTPSRQNQEAARR